MGTGARAGRLQLLSSPPPTPGGGSGACATGLAHHSPPAGPPYQSGSQSVSQATLGQGSQSQVDINNLPPFHIVHRTKIGTIAHIPKAVKNNCGRSLAQVLKRVANSPNFIPNFIRKPPVEAGKEPKGLSKYVPHNGKGFFGPVWG